MSDTADQRFAPPQAHVADLASGEMVLAGRGARFGAAVVDFIVILCAVLVVWMVPALRPLLEGQEKGNAAGLWQWDPASALLGFAVFLVVQGWLLVTRGQTIGKLLLKLRIVRSDGSKAEAWRLLGLRYGIGFVLNINVGASMIFGLVDSLLIFRESRKCLHDSIADTQVIKL